MWLYLRKACLSVVVDKDNPTRRLVRSRIKGDIETVFPDAEVLETPDHDYHYRAFVTDKALADALAREVMAMDYTNFKASLDHSDRKRSAVYWGVYDATLTEAGFE